MDEERQNQPEGERTPPPTPIPAGVATVEPEPPPRTSGLAIASLILAILGFFTCITAPIGLVLGIIALNQTGRDPRLQGRAIALAGVIVGGVAIFMSLFMAAIMFPVFVRAREAAQRTSCMNNLKQLDTALQLYALDHSDHYPAAESWNEALRPYYKGPNYLVCRSDKTGGPSYGMNDRIGSLAAKDILSPADVVSLFDSVPGLNQSGGRELLSSPPRHIYETNNIGFADGHVQSVSDPKTLNWDPKALP